MGNVVDSLVSGFTKVLAKPLDFLSGKACSTACGPTWDVVCYVENFCVASLAKTADMLFLLYLGKDLMDDPSIVSAIDEETEFTALVEEALLESILHGDDDVS